MKKGKFTLGLVVSLASIGALSACNEVTYSDGVVLTYTDAAGTKTVVTAEDLFGAYQTTTGQVSTDFDAIEEVLIRNYYKDSARATDLAALEKDAKLAVQSVKEEAETNATNNKTSYQEEFEKLLTSNGVESIDELYEAKLYNLEKDKFTKNYNSSTSRVEGMRDGSYTDENGTKQTTFPYSSKYGRGNDGYLLEQLPYHIAHILVKVSAEADNHTQGTITEAEARKLSDVIKYIAGASVIPGSSSTKRATFGDIAKQQSDDTGSAERYGELSVMDRKQADEFVNEFKFGIYAYEAIFNQINQDPAKNPYATEVRKNPTGDEADTYKLTDRLLFSKEATYTDAGLEQTDEEYNLPDGEHYLSNFFKAENGIGRIPYGAAVALASAAKDPNLGWTVNNGQAIYYPRNVLFNKYFNKHNVAVIVPNEIAYNDNTKSPLGTPGDYRTEDFVGEPSDAYRELPGFQVDTKDALPASVLGQDDNVLTNEKGQIILVARAGASSYQGVHFMVIERSALSEYGTTADMSGAKKVQEVPAPAAGRGSKYEDKDITTLSEYYTIHTPKSTSFPTYNNGTSSLAKTTYINQLAESEETYGNTRDTLEGRIKDYNTVADTFRFQYLIENGSLAFNTNNDLVKGIQEKVQTWISTKRETNHENAVEKFDDTWAAFAEYLTRANEARTLKQDGSQKLISETCAIGYSSEDAKNGTGVWAIGGACYAKK